MKNVMSGVIIAMAFAGSAYAAQTNTGCQGNCPSGGDTTNSGGIGYGGSGGNASAIGVGVGVGIGGTGGSGGAGGAGGNGGAGGSVASSGNSKNSNQSSASNGGNNTNVGGNTYSSSYRAAASTAYAPPIAPTALCMGSSSAGGSGMTFGFSIGTSWTDENCMRLEQIRTVAAVLGDKETAAQMMCSVPAYREAREATGKPCQ